MDIYGTPNFQLRKIKETSRFQCPKCHNKAKMDIKNVKGPGLTESKKILKKDNYKNL